MGSASTELIRILHVDDDPALADLTATFLESENEHFDVTLATATSEGLERLAADDFDCIVSDYDMPDRNGIEFLEAVREDDPELPFILFTGKGSEEIASEAVSAGVTDYLQKETGKSQYVILANRIRNAVERYRSRIEQRRQRERQARQRNAIFELTTDEAVTDATFEKAVRRITETAAHILDVASVNVWLLEDDTQSLRCVDNYDRSSGEHERGMELIADDYPRYFEALQTHISLDADDARADPRTAELTENYLDVHDIGALLDATLRAEGEVIGVVCHEHVGGTREWTDDEIQFASNVADVVHRALRNQTHREQERRFAAIFNDPNILAGLIDTDGTLFDINQTALEYVDATMEDVTGEPFWETPWWDEESKPLIQQKVEQAVKGQYVEYETELLDPDDRSYNVIGIIRPVTDGSGEVVSLIVSARDVTKLKKRERELRRERDRLDEFASIVSHDLRNPINVSSGRLELARAEYESEHLDTIADALDRMERIIDDMLWLAREGQDIGETEPVDLQKAVEGAWTIVANGTDGAELVYADDDDGGPSTIEADYDRLRQLLENLFRNAIQHGGSDVRVRVELTNTGFVIEDDGPGIPPVERDHVFESGYSTSAEGTGFGLSIVERVGDAHGWDVRVTEGTEVGARFEISGVEIE